MHQDATEIRRAAPPGRGRRRVLLIGATGYVGGRLLGPLLATGASLEGADAAFHLIHSMGASGDFEALERFGAAREAARS